MTPLDASLEAVSKNYGLTVADLMSKTLTDPQTAHFRRVAVYVAHVKLGMHEGDVARGMNRRLVWVREAVLETGSSAWASRTTAQAIDETYQRARALLETGVRTEPAAPAAASIASPLCEERTAEARKLRKKGWAIPGLAKRYGVPPETIARVIGEPWGASL